MAANEEYRDLFRGAFDTDRITIDLVAIALETFQATLWNGTTARFDFPFSASFSASEHRGYELFFGEARCSECHVETLLNGFSDQRFHNLAVPQIGPGLADAAPEDSGLDIGRARVTGRESDRFAFRTPPLRNVMLTPPYMHNGAYSSVESAIRHHLDPVGALLNYDGSELPPGLRGLIHDSPETIAQLTRNVADSVPATPLSDTDIAHLIAFLETLTDRSELTRPAELGVPERVPSGLPIDDWAGGDHPFRIAP